MRWYPYGFHLLTQALEVSPASPSLRTFTPPPGTAPESPLRSAPLSPHPNSVPPATPRSKPAAPPQYSSARYRSAQRTKAAPKPPPPSAATPASALQAAADQPS